MPITKRPFRAAAGLSILVACLWGRAHAEGKPNTLPYEMRWPEPKTENRPGCYWWWMGSAVDKENITWNLETMRKAGMGGGTIVPIYGVKGYEDRYIKHLSPKFV